MRKTYTVEKGAMHDTHMYFEVQNTENNVNIHPAGRIITDSDEMAFIYLMEEENGYSYLKFPQIVWPLLVETLQSSTNPMLKWGTEQIELVNFQDELPSLIYNIEGNSNYGEVFTTAVEETFAELLREA